MKPKLDVRGGQTDAEVAFAAAFVIIGAIAATSGTDRRQQIILWLTEIREALAGGTATGVTKFHVQTISDVILGAKREADLRTHPFFTGEC